jgi:hypothetical protein
VFYFFDTGSCFVSQTGLELEILYLSLLGSGIIGMHLHAQLGGGSFNKKITFMICAHII